MAVATLKDGGKDQAKNHFKCNSESDHSLHEYGGVEDSHPHVLRKEGLLQDRTELHR